MPMSTSSSCKQRVPLLGALLHTDYHRAFHQHVRGQEKVRGIGKVLQDRPDMHLRRIKQLRRCSHAASLSARQKGWRRCHLSSAGPAHWPRLLRTPSSQPSADCLSLALQENQPAGQQASRGLSSLGVRASEEEASARLMPLLSIQNGTPVEALDE